MLSKLFVVVLVIIAAAVLYMRFSAVRISGRDARDLVAKGALLLDVRSPGEFAGGHIDGAISIPVQELVGRMDELGDKSGEIVVYCQSGTSTIWAASDSGERDVGKLHLRGLRPRVRPRRNKPRSTLSEVQPNRSRGARR
jgi:hypothetical protein